MFTWTWTRTTLLVFLLCEALTSALRCDWLKHYGHRSDVCLNLLEHMGGHLTEEDAPLLFPYGLYRHIRNTEVDSQLVFVRDSLKQIFHLYYHGNRSSVTWNPIKTEHFLESLHSQIDKLNSCVSTNNTTNYSLRKYYKRLSKIVLDRTGSSAESWELIRKETKDHLDQLQLLVNFIRAQEVALYNNNNNKRVYNNSGRHSMTTTTPTMNCTVTHRV